MHIAHNATRHHDLFKPFSGPQCIEDCDNNSRLRYNPKYLKRKSFEPTTQPPEIASNIKGNKNNELKETLKNSRPSFRTCSKCSKIRALGPRAANKYPLGKYNYNKEEKSIVFSCSDLFDITCQTPSDLAPLPLSDIKSNKEYIAYSVKEKCFWGFVIKLAETLDETETCLQIIKQFGPKLFDLNDFSDITSMSEIRPRWFRLGVCNKFNRFRATFSEEEFQISSLDVDLREAKCCQAFFDENYGSRNIQPIDPDDPDEKITFDSLMAVGNSHLVFESAMQLHCVKCDRCCTGFENMDNIQIRNHGILENLSQINEPALYNAIKDSKARKALDLTLSERFKNTDVYQATSNSIRGICTQCEPFYHINDDNEVIPLANVNDDDQDSQQSQDSQSSVKNRTVKINKWGEENLFTLNLHSIENFRTFMESLNLMELMSITPLHVQISIYRCYASQQPVSRYGGIAYPLKTPMAAKSLPWDDFSNVPIIIVHRDEQNLRESTEMKIDLNKIFTAYQWWTRLIEVNNEVRTLNRLVDCGFAVWSETNWENLRKQLDEHGVPSSLRTVEMTEEQEKLTEPISKELLQTWINSEFEFSQSVLDSLTEEFSEAVNPFDAFWISLKEFSFIYLQSQISDTSDAPMKQRYEEWIKNDTYVTIKTLREYCESKGYLNRIDNLEQFDVAYHIHDEFVILSQKFSNDLGTNRVNIGGKVTSAEEHPDVIIDRNLRDTALDRRSIAIDRENPATEWRNSFHPRAYPDVFLTGDGAYDQPRPIPLRPDEGKDEKTYREEYIHRVATMKGVQRKPNLIFLMCNQLKRLDAMTAAKVTLKDVDVTTIPINHPTDDQVRNDAKGKANLLLQNSGLIRDSDPSYVLLKHKAQAVKRDLEYEDKNSRPREKPILPSLFITHAIPYTNSPIIHRLFESDPEKLKNPHIRRQQALLHPLVVEWMSTFQAEINLNFLRKVYLQISIWDARSMGAMETLIGTMFFIPKTLENYAMT